MELSLIIPSIRPGFFSQFMKSVEKNTQGIDLEVLENHEVGNLYEIIDKEFRRATKKYVCLTCDETVFHEDWAKSMIEMLDPEPKYTMGNFNLTTDDRGSSRPLNIRYYNKLCSIIPFFRREDVDGDMFDLRFKRFYGDIDLSLRFWAAGGKVITCPQSRVTMFSNRDNIKKKAVSEYSKLDEIEFKKKWDNYDFNLHGNTETPRMLQETVRNCPKFGG